MPIIATVPYLGEQPLGFGGTPEPPPEPDGLDFSALTALPTARQSAVTTAANAAAATLDVSAQSIIDALAAGRGLASLLPNDGCLLASSGGATTVQGDPVGAIRSWTGVELATQSNASLQPASGAAGLVGSTGKTMALGDLSAWAEGESMVTLHYQGTSHHQARLWKIGTSNGHGAHPNVLASPPTILDDFGSTARSASSASNSYLDLGIYNPSIAVGGSQIYRWNGSQIHAATVNVSFNSAATFLSNPTGSYVGVVSGLALNSTLYTTAQRNAVREFCRNYYGVTY